MSEQKKGRNRAATVLIYLAITVTIAVGLVVALSVVVPPVPKINQPPVIDVISPINGTVNQTVFINATITDDNNNITSINWNQESGSESNFTAIDSQLFFTPLEAGSYLFSVNAQDDKFLSTAKGVIINVHEAQPVEVPTIPVPGEENPQPPAPPNQTGNVTVPTSPPTQPVPVPTTLKIDVVGDIDNTAAGNAVFNQIKSRNPTNVFILGDLGYDKDLKWFKSTYGTLGNLINCIGGNHEDDTEDGTVALEKETAEYCSDSWYIKKGSTLIFGFNTNGNLTSQLEGAKNLVISDNFMIGIKNLFVETHKPCVTAPNMHHPVEPAIQKFCETLKSTVAGNVKVHFDSAHNHILASSADGTYMTSGAGGRSHYSCNSPTTEFPFCDNSHYGFIEHTITANGTITSQFIDANGGIVK